MPLRASTLLHDAVAVSDPTVSLTDVTWRAVAGDLVRISLSTNLRTECISLQTFTTRLKT